MRDKCACVLMAVILIGLAQAVGAVPGDTVKSIAAPHSCPQGMAYDGKYLWVVDRHSDMIYKVDPSNGKTVDSLPAPGYVPRGLAWDGARLWCVDAEAGSIYAINPETEIVEQTIGCPVSVPTGLAWDGRFLWVAADRDDKVYQISTEDGTTTKSIPAPTRGVTGLTFDGTYLWASDRTRDMIYMFTPDRGDVIIAFDAPGPHALGLAWDGKYLWSVDYQKDRIYQLVVDDGTPVARYKEKVEQVEFIMQARNYGPGQVQKLDLYIAIPHNLNNQDLLAPVQFIPEPTDILTDKWGQQVAHFQFADVAATQFKDVSMLAKAKLYQTRYFIFPNRVGPLSEIPDSVRRVYLADDTKFSMSDPIIQNAVKAAVGNETNPYWIARRIFNYIIEHMEYELAGGWNIAPAVLERGNGSCSEYSFVYIAMCRAAGVPARYAGSIVIRGDDASYDDVFHRWVEVYLPRFGWVPVDPSGGDAPLPADRAGAFGNLNNRYLITTMGGGGSEFLEWGYNANVRYTTKGRCKVEAEYFGEWTPLTADEAKSADIGDSPRTCPPQR